MLCTQDEFEVNLVCFMCSISRVSQILVRLGFDLYRELTGVFEWFPTYNRCCVSGESGEATDHEDRTERNECDRV